MSETNGVATGRMPSRAAPETVLDLDAFMARARPGDGRPHVQIGGTRYPVRQLIGLTGQEELDLAALDEAVQRATTPLAVRRAMFDRAFTLVRILVPEMPDRERLALTYEQAIAVADLAWDYAVRTNPPSADTGAAPGENSKPASAVPLASTPAA